MTDHAPSISGVDLYGGPYDGLHLPIEPTGTDSDGTWMLCPETCDARAVYEPLVPGERVWHHTGWVELPGDYPSDP